MTTTKKTAIPTPIPISIPSMMRGIAVRGRVGPAEALHAIDLPVPEPRAGELLIRVRAAGANRPDLLQREGKYPMPPGAPETLGLEVAGDVVIAAGRFARDDRVCALLLGGGYAEYAVVDARHALPIPVPLDVVHAAALPETVLTVYANVFEHGGLVAGETLLVHGATSGIGTTAIQMAKCAGARVIATARGADKVEAARKLGADIVVDTTVDDFAAAAVRAGGVDVALDMVGRATFDATLTALNRGGRIVYIATLGGASLDVSVPALMQKQLVLTGSMLRPRSADEKARLTSEVERVVGPWIAAGRFAPLVDKTFPLEEAAQAHAYLESGRHTGKIVLVTG